ncbi:hypothetical protein GLAREA_04672 [Glarea lozoyensis ATCC 20868]|uniref:Clock-controlled protein 6 n=1 Tax=Glarea lozoyensis (strain ATCC 20868 / MF5171) TaxID=1116229 RepID=S3D7A0_GLAL2|nr:uncharacterized protein GLAREA_04672 [Glarea lozoyensis ATCC 20868]EPE27881.1 hypothetical protein GLAREA_04672 [Glarea lozoyensis ATCC 20868]
MKAVQSLLPVFGLVAAVNAMWLNETTAYTTETVTSYTTYCPVATTVTQGTKTYTATAGQTLTITDCPCTIKHPKPTTTPAPPAPPAGTAPPVYITTTVSEYTTYCPVPTQVIQGNVTYTVTSATTLTIKNCPCTVSYPATTYTTVTLSSTTTYCPAPTTVTIGPVTTYCPTAGTYTIPVVTVTPVPGTPPTPAPVPVTTTAVPGVPAPTGGVPVGPVASPTGPLIANGAEKVSAGLFGLVGFVAMLL